MAAPLQGLPLLRLQPSQQQQHRFCGGGGARSVSRFCGHFPSERAKHSSRGFWMACEAQGRTGPRYTYTRLADLFSPRVGVASKVNVFAVIAGPAVLEDAGASQHCVRLVDESLEALGTKGCVVLSTKSTTGSETKEFLPGRVLRVHRAVVLQSTNTVRLCGLVAEYHEDKRKYQGCLSWVVFSTDGCVVAASSPKYTHTPQDDVRAQQLLLWNCHRTARPRPSAAAADSVAGEKAKVAIVKPRTSATASTVATTELPKGGTSTECCKKLTDIKPNQKPSSYVVFVSAHHLEASKPARGRCEQTMPNKHRLWTQQWCRLKEARRGAISSCGTAATCLAHLNRLSPQLCCFGLAHKQQHEHWTF